MHARLDWYKTSPTALKAMAGLESFVKGAGLEPALLELVRMRASQVNGCAYCLDMHVADAVKGGESAQRLAVLPAWRDTAVFEAHERAALALAESITVLPDARTRELEDASAREHLTDEQYSAVSWLAIAMNAFNRVSITSQHPVRPQEG